VWSTGADERDVCTASTTGQGSRAERDHWRDMWREDARVRGSAEPARSDLRSRVIRLGLIPRTYVHRGGGAGPPRRVQLTSANAPPFPSRPVSPFPHTSDTRRRTSSRLPRTAGFRSSRQIPVFRRTGNGREKRRHMQTCFDVQSINGSVPTGRGRPASPRPPAPGVRSRERVY